MDKWISFLSQTYKREYMLKVLKKLFLKVHTFFPFLIKDSYLDLTSKTH